MGLVMCVPPPAQSPPLRAAEENPGLNMNLNNVATGSERFDVEQDQDVFDALVGIPDPIRTTVDAADDRSIGKYPMSIQTTEPQTVTWFQQDRFPGGEGSVKNNHLEFDNARAHPYWNNTESQLDDPWQRGNVNKPASMSYSRLIDLITGQARVGGDNP